MPALTSQINPRAPAFAANVARMNERLGEVRALQDKVVAESSSKVEKFDTSLYLAGWGGGSTDAEVMLTPVLRNRGDIAVDDVSVMKG